MGPYGGIYPDGMLKLFHTHVARELCPNLSLIFRHVV